MLPSDFKPHIQRFDAVDSTNIKLKALASAGATEGTVVIAKSQSHGRGRGARQWHSPAGGLYFSVLLFAKDSRHATDLPILAGTAVAQAVKELLPKSVEVSVKWPNDCLVNWKKVAGILCESVTSHGTGACVVGVGINVNVPKIELLPFEKNPFGAVSFTTETAGGTFDTEKVFQTVLTKIFTLYRVYQEQGFQPVQYLWEKNCHLIGKRVELRESGYRVEEGKSSGGEVGVTTGTVLGIDESGALVLSNSRGERHSYVSGEISCFWP